MSGTIVVDRIESDASYASSINIASPIQISNTITGNVNFDSGTLFVDSVGNKIGAGTTTPAARLHLEGTGANLASRGIRLAYDGTYYADIVQEGAGGLSYRTYGGLAHKWQQSGTTVMDIDGSGRVTMPYQPMFQAYLDNLKNFSTFSVNEAIPFDQTSINQGSNYNTSTYRFTAPIAGKYIFSCYMRVDNINSTAGDYVHPFWSKNGEQAVDGITARMILGSTMTSNDYQFMSSTIMVNLAANDYIQILHGDGNAAGANGGSAYYQGKQCWMNGFLIG